MVVLILYNLRVSGTALVGPAVDVWRKMVHTSRMHCARKLSFRRHCRRWVTTTADDTHIRNGHVQNRNYEIELLLTRIHWTVCRVYIYIYWQTQHTYPPYRVCVVLYLGRLYIRFAGIYNLQVRVLRMM